MDLSTCSIARLTSHDRKHLVVFHDLVFIGMLGFPSTPTTMHLDLKNATVDRQNYSPIGIGVDVETFSFNRILISTTEVSCDSSMFRLRIFQLFKTT